jgi:hypothetical protein
MTQTIPAVAPVAPPEYPTGAEAKQTNPYAVAGLAFGILPLPPIGAVLSIVGIVRSRASRVGYRMSVVGLVLSILWAVGGLVTAVVAPHVLTSNTPGCQVIADFDKQYPASKLDADRTSGSSYAADLQAYRTALTKAAQVTRHPEVRVLALTELSDIELLLQYAGQNAQPDAATLAKQKTDADVLRKACGSF